MKPRRALLAGCAAALAAAVLAYFAGIGQEARPADIGARDGAGGRTEPVQGRTADIEARDVADTGARTEPVQGRTDAGARDGMRWAEVTRVVDGDTIHLDDKSHRLVLVNTPERGQPGFDEAADFVKERCGGRTVAYDLNDPQPTDRYGRQLSLVYCDGPLMPSINELLIEAGHSGQYTRFCSESEFAGQAWTGC